MRLTFFILLLLIHPFTLAAEPQQSCMDKATTKGSPGVCSEADSNEADAELNRIYKLLLTQYKDDRAFIERLRLAQVAWIRFRDAELAMKFPPHPDQPGYYGSALPMCETLYLEQLTKDRIATLKQWLVGIPEGDVCSGSVKRPWDLKH